MENKKFNWKNLLYHRKFEEFLSKYALDDVPGRQP